MSKYPLCRLLAHADPFEFIPQQDRKARYLSANRHDHLGCYIRRDSCCSEFWRLSRHSFLPRLRRSRLLPGLPILFVILVHPKRAGI